MASSLDDKPRVLVIGSFAPPDVPCGITSSVNEIARSVLSRTHALDIVTTYRDPHRTRSLLERVRNASVLGAKTAWLILRTNIALVDVHTASGRDFLKHSLIIVMARALGRPSLLRIHGGSFITTFESAGTAKQRLIRAVLRLSERVVALSEGWRLAIERLEPSTRVVVIPNSVDCQHFENVGKGRNPKARGILLLGNLCRAKGHFDLLEAAAALARKNMDFRLLLPGAEREIGVRDALTQRAQELGILDRTSFLGPVCCDERDRTLQQTAVFVLPSYAENMPISIMEALATGLPVVASRVGAIPEMLVDGTTGRLITPGNVEELTAVLGELLDNAVARAAMGKRGQQAIAATCDRNAVGQQTAALYDELIASPRSRDMHPARRR